MKKFFLSIIIFVGILCVGNIVATSNFNNDLNFEFNDVSYNLNLEELASKNDISLEDYPYYFVGEVIEKNSSHLALFYSKERISAEEKETDETDTTTCYYVCGGKETLEFVIETDGSIQEGKMVDLKKSSIVIADTGFIASNQDIYCNADSILVFSNSKDEYNEKEKVEIYDKIVEKVDEEISDIEINSDIVSSENTEIIEENTKKIEFSYKGKTYTVDLAASDLGINLDEYEYYFVTGDGLSRFTLYYSKERMRINYAYSGRYEVKGGEETLSIAIGSDGAVGECNIVDLKDKYVTINNNYVASNQNIYYDGKLIFIKNSGYEYDKTQEKGEECNEIVKTTDAINVYEKAAVNYDIVATMAKGSAVKRVKKGVNERNGHTWDKVILSNGKEGYVFTDGLEIAEDTEKISFKYNDVTYTTYLSSTGLGVNLDAYEYYFVTGNGTSNFGLYYSRERIWASYAYSGRYEVKGGEETLKIAIGLDGSVGECNIVDLKDKYVTINNNYVASNQNIYYGDKKIFNRNSGYEYNEAKEEGEECNEIVKTTNAINVYEKAAVNYDIIATIASGSAIKRVKKGVNERNGHIWDKVILSNGKDGYVFTDELEIAEDTKEISFKYNDITYTTYLSSTGLGVNLDAYEYYFVTRDGTSNFLLYYSKERVWAGYGYSNWHEIKGGEETLQIAIGLDGSVGECNIIDLKNGDVTIINSNFVASNQDIYYNNTIVFKMREYVENGSLAYVTNTSLQDVAYEPNAYEGIIKGEKEYNAMSEAEHLERDFILSEEKLGLSAAANTATALLGLPNAGEALEYYLTKGTFGWSYNHYSYEITPFCTDHTRREISLYSGLKESSYMRNALVEQINATMELGEKLCIEEGQEVKFSNALEKREEVKDVRDWHYTLGKYRVRVESVVKKIGNSYQLNMKYYIEDYYDWDPTTDRKGFLDEFVPMLYELNYAGMSRNYTNYGEIEYSSTWEKGQRRSEDDITKLISERK